MAWRSSAKVEEAGLVIQEERPLNWHANSLYSGRRYGIDGLVRVGLRGHLANDKELCDVIWTY